MGTYLEYVLPNESAHLQISRGARAPRARCPDETLTMPLAPLLLLLTLPTLAEACESEADCSYFGACVAGRCVCRHQYTGNKCEAFAFAPVDAARSSGLRTINASTGEQTSSWGGSVLLDEAGTYHMFAAEMTNSVGIKSWRSNSRVVHATAKPSAGGSWQFVRRDVAQPVFAHEPTVSRAPTGEWVMFFTTDAGETPGRQCSLPLTCGHNGSSCMSDPNAQQCPCKPHCAPLSTRMSWASKPEGPWSKPVLVPSEGNGDTNLACVIRHNSSLVCVGRPGLGLMRADHWRNVSGYTWYPIHYGSGEDPMIWLDRSGSEEGGGGSVEVLHAVLHGGGWGDPFGHHYWSAYLIFIPFLWFRCTRAHQCRSMAAGCRTSSGTDGGWNWEGSSAKVYTNVVEVTGQAPKILSRRERPHVVLDATNQPVALTNGVTEAWPCCSTSINHRTFSATCASHTQLAKT